MLGPLFGTFVDRHRKKTALMGTTAIAVVCFAVATSVFSVVPADDLLELGNPWFWVLVASTLIGSVAAQMRGIALSTCVTLLVPEDARDRANGMVGTVTGISFAITSVFSGLVIGQLGMGWAYFVLAHARDRRPGAHGHDHDRRARIRNRSRPARQRHCSTSGARSMPSAPCRG